MLSNKFRDWFMTSVDESSPISSTAGGPSSTTRPQRPPMPTLAEGHPQQHGGGSVHSFEGPDLGDDQQSPPHGGGDGSMELQHRRVATGGASRGGGYGAFQNEDDPDENPGAEWNQRPPFNEGDDGSVAGEGEFGKSQIGPWQAGWNVTNAIQGMFVVSLPYAVLHGGWWGVFALTFVAYICYHTGLLLVECLYDENGARVRNSYKSVAESCWGRPWGGRLVLTAQMIELLMTCILYVVLCGDLLENSFPGSAMDKMGWMMISTAMLMPCAFLTDLRAVSWLSFWNAVSHIVINFIILAYCLSQASRWSLKSIKFTLNITTFPTVLGIVVFSYTSHIFLPTLEGSMTDRTKFRPMLKWSHVAAAIFKGVFGFVGFLTFGEYTQDEVTNNLPSQQFKAVLNMILVLKALLSYPLPYFASIELLDLQFFRGRKMPSCFSADGSMREWALALRICLVLFTLFMAISIPHFALLMGLVGNITGTMLSFIWPCVFHLQLKGHKLSMPKKICSYAIIGLGGFFGVIGIYYSSVQLNRAVNAIDEYG